MLVYTSSCLKVNLYSTSNICIGLKNFDNGNTNHCFITGSHLGFAFCNYIDLKKAALCKLYSTHSTFWTIYWLYILWMLTVWNCHIITKVLLWYSTMYFYFPSLKLLNCLGIDKHWFNFMQQYNSLDSWMLRWINPL